MSEPTKFTPDMAERMAFLEDKVSRALTPYRQNTEAAIAVAALLRCARKLIELYPPAKQLELVELAVAFLKKERVDLVEDSKLVLPPGWRLQ